MQTTYIADTDSRSIGGPEFRWRRYGHPALAAIIAAGVAVVATSLAVQPSSPSSARTSGPAPATHPSHDALRTLENACTGGDAVSCNDLGVSQLRGYGAPADVDAAARAFELSCRAGSPDGCGNLGALYESGAGVPADISEAARLYAHACGLGGALGCSNLGALYARGRGVERDLAEARRLFARACQTGSAAGCDNLLQLSEPRL
jgi:TPR repeat protein